MLRNPDSTYSTPRGNDGVTLSQDQNVALSSKPLPKNVEAFLGKALAGSKRRLNRAFRKLKPLGPDSELHRDCIAHLRNLQSYQMPADDALWSTYRGALQNAWWACWRSYDFSVEALLDRFGERRLNNLRVRGVSQWTDAYGSEWFEGMAPLFDCDGNPTGRSTTAQRFWEIAEALNIFFKNEPAGLVFSQKQELGKLTSLVGSTLTWCYFKDGINVNNDTPLLLTNCLALEKTWMPHPRRTPTELRNCYFDSLSIERAENANILITTCQFGEQLSIVQFTPKGSVDFSSNAVRGTLDANRWIFSRQRARLPQMNSGTFSSLESKEAEFEFQPSQDVSVSIEQAAACKFTFPEGMALGEFAASGEEIELDLPSTHIRGSLSVDFTRSSRGQTLSMMHGRIEGDLKISGPADLIEVVDVSVGGDVTILTSQGSNGRLRMDYCSLEGSLKCGSRYWRQISFQNSTVSRATEFNDVVATEMCSFNESHFHDDASFDLSSDAFGPQLKSGPVDFRDVVFEKDAHFRGRRFDASANFDRTVWKGVPDFHLAELHPDTSFVSACFDNPPLSHRRRAAGADRAIRDYVMGRYERAFRSLKLKAEGLRARSVESRFHRLEMVARRQSSGTSLPEKLFSRLYDSLSNYGENFILPLGWWALQIVVMGFGYWLVRLPKNVEWNARVFSWGWDAMLLSFNNSIRPFYSSSDGFDRMVISKIPVDAPMFYYWWFVEQALKDHSLLFRTMLVAQNLIGIVLIFLFLLAVRRRFQISE